MTQYTSVLLVSLTVVMLIGCSGSNSAAEYLTSAREHLQAGEISAALIETRNAVAQDPENASARSLLGELELMVSNPVDAESQFLRAVEFGSPQDSIMRDLAQAYLLQGKNNELLDIDTATLTDEDRADVLAFQTTAALINGEPAMATRLAAEALKADPFSAFALTANARLQLADSNISQARTYLAKAMDNSPDHSPAWELLGDIEASEQRFPEAISAYSQAVATASNQLSPLFKRARTYLALSDLESADADITVLEKAEINSPDIKLIKSEIQLRQGDFANAQLTLEQSLTKYPTYAPLVRTIAITHMLLGNIGQAEQYGQQYLESQNSDDARILLATIRLQSERFEQAEKTLQPLTDSGRLNILGAQVLATTQLKQSKLDDAINTMLGLKSNLERAGITESVNLAMLSAPANFMANELLDGEQAVAGNGSDLPYLSERDLQLISAVEALAKRQTDTALTVTNALLQEDPDNAALQTLLGRVHLSADNPVKAAEALSTAIDLTDTPRTEVILAAMIEVNAGNTEKANKLLNSALADASRPMRERILLGLATISAAQGDQEKMSDQLTQAYTENPGAYRTSLAMANYYASKGDLQAVLNSLSQLSDTGKQNPVVIELTANTYVALGQFDEAIELIAPMVQLEPGTARWRFLRAKVNAGKNELASVGHDLDMALRIDPGHVPSLMAKANLDVLTQDLHSAEARLVSLKEIIPNNEIVKQLGERIDAARQQSTQAPDDQSPRTDEVPTTTEGVIQAAQIQWKNSQADAAIKTLADWLVENPDDVVVRRTIANLYDLLNRPDDAIAEYTEVLAQEPENFIALNNLAWYLRNDDPDAAIKYAERAVALQPNNVATLDTLAVIQFEQDRLKDAGETFARIRALNPVEPTILYHGAMIQSGLGNKQDAKSLLEPLISGGFDFPEAAAAKTLYDEL